MGHSLRVLTWNCRHATEQSAAWDYLRELNPDIALLQEVGSIPLSVATKFDRIVKPATNRDGRLQSFSTAILVRGELGPAIPMATPLAWVNSEFQRFAGNVVAHRVRPIDWPDVNVVSVYSPAWPIDRTWLAGVDVSGVKLTQQKWDVWVMDLVWASLRERTDLDQPWIIAGDFNSSETFDHWPGGPRGNREFLDRMAGLGLCECLRFAQDKLTPTFRSPRGVINAQIDHLFTTPALGSRLRCCETGDPDRVFRQGLSDHLPIIAEFEGM